MLSAGKKEHPSGMMPQEEVVHGVAQPHRPLWQVSPLSQVPQEPPQPSPPHDFPAQFGTQRLDGRREPPPRRFLFLRRPPFRAPAAISPNREPSAPAAAADSTPSTWRRERELRLRMMASN